jgi:GrpB-like predicted nucleotidyltransferase (UPF0157 family)
MFEDEKARLMALVGEWVADIQHIGSTSVPGLGAKPVIDILIGVRSLADADAHCLQPIVSLGYEYVPAYEAGMPYRRFFRKNDAQGERTHHIHLVEIGGEFWERHLVFRDYLRAHPEAAKDYERLKRELAPRFTNGNDYAEAKTDFIRSVEAAAWRWKAEQKA